MAKRPPKDRDFAINALRIVEQAIGEHLDGTPLEIDAPSKSATAVARGRKGGAIGGREECSPYLRKNARRSPRRPRRLGGLSQKSIGTNRKKLRNNAPISLYLFPRFQ
jgi:hypothetical protein